MIQCDRKYVRTIKSFSVLYVSKYMFFLVHCNIVLSEITAQLFMRYIQY